MAHKLLFARQTPLAIKLAVFVFASMLLMILDLRYAYVVKVRSALLYITSPIQYLVDWPIKTYHSLTQSVTSQKSLVNENIELRYQQVLLKGKLQRFISLKKENKQLRELLAYTVAKKNTRFLLAELLSMKTASYRQMLVLDRGQKDQVFIGQAVFDASGVIGQVVEVGPLTSTVMLITDHKSAVPVKNSRSGERAILIGLGKAQSLALINLASTSTVKVGDELLTSGLGRRYPEGYPIGVVEYVHRGVNDAFITVIVKPAAKISQSRLMLLTWHNEKDQTLLKELSELAKKNYSAGK